MNSKIRKVLSIVTAALAIASAVGLIICAIDIFRSGNIRIAESGVLTEDIYSPKSISERFKIIAPVIYALLAAVLAGVVSRAFYVEKTVFTKPHRIEKKAPINAKAVTAIRIIVLIAAVVLVVIGITNGGMHDVLVKAKKICMECVGLG